ncbi:bifunctional [glutamine synthetase] adenylyltransferase/[glutamine synthetase]-adenylyl-L-tyrosine phosphorylase [Sandaracinobacteroides saxicola]|uniref:Bifunctional [glutamine synthetase] adenylyltransferase/[glutamine synthetase]-adenylyl-L-tyrosine phosphorylase n=1 Tax=Sandaracinobacteroides saxicola TaxID=2759707 RepID=A0A7G5IKK6_9SPHN|nr:bifunctional [glutamine synthetase] adenylyltransferase/[glutamine synthetase]-adenylyl-L-tyrosine phosphorylase [Sandaracinobacteroides saxicola]QMW23898.1 bifunctional [glutamine synthetase] adenylyltransferase/[glutamine synthetase]-adenylyl-L-tyrosine phosphorylase [Sandaracinobacteroides saxicola]
MSLPDAIHRANSHSPFLRGLIRRETALLDTLTTDGPEAALTTALARLDPAHPLPSVRHARAGVALTVALADLAGLWPLETVTAALTRFADSALDAAITAAFAERDSSPAGLAALALGKMGSHELNYSSDIDLIFIHDPDTLPRRPTEEPGEAAVRLVRRIAAILSERTADGYALRVDLRLRPDPDSTPASLALNAALHYYQSQALAWERLAFIRARAAAGDTALGRAFLTDIEPFVWRRTLDFSAIADIRDVSHRIRDHYSEGQKPGPGYDLKRGRGGIREIEFFAQIHQLIFGGRDDSLRAPATLDALPALAAAGRITSDDATTLADAYRRLRTLEHRLQMLDDAQTHSIPRLAAARAAVAGLAGAPHWRALESALLPLTRTVSRAYDRLVAEDGDRKPRLPHDSDALDRWLAKARLADPPLVRSLLAGWRAGRPRALRAPEARRSFEILLPTLLPAVARGKQGRAGLLRLDSFIRALPSGVQFWGLLSAHPPLVTLLARLLTATPLLADALARDPGLIDTLLDPPPPLPGPAEAQAELALATRNLDGEALLDRVRRWAAERRFLLGVRLLDAAIDPLDAAATLAAIADAAVLRLADAASARFAARHGRCAGCHLVILALGRWGGQALTAQSDLDLVLLFSGDFRRESDGPAPLSATAWFNRLGQRLIADLSVATAAGRLFDIDTRLRPSGAQGLLAVSLDSFAAYQSAEAESWEHMALTRARPLGADAAAVAAAQAMIDTIVAQPRDPATLPREAMAMRREIARHKPAAGPWDLKLMRGGLVDLEFIVQTRALLRGAPIPPQLDRAIAAVAPELADAHGVLMRLLVLLRLVMPAGDGAAPSAATGLLLARALGLPGFAAVKSALTLARQQVLAAWATTFQSGETA